MENKVQEEENEKCNDYRHFFCPRNLKSSTDTSSFPIKKTDPGESRFYLLNWSTGFIEPGLVNESEALKKGMYFKVWRHFYCDYPVICYQPKYNSFGLIRETDKAPGFQSGLPTGRSSQFKNDLSYL